MKAGDVEASTHNDWGRSKFRSTLNAALKEKWMPLVQTVSATDGEQVYILLRAEAAKDLRAEGAAQARQFRRAEAAKDARAEGAKEDSQGRVRSETEHAAPGSVKNTGEPRRGDSNAPRKFTVLVITIAKRDATVVQVTLSPKNLVLLMQAPEGTGKALTEEAIPNMRSRGVAIPVL